MEGNKVVTTVKTNLRTGSVVLHRGKRYEVQDWKDKTGEVWSGLWSEDRGTLVLACVVVSRRGRRELPVSTIRLCDLQQSRERKPVNPVPRGHVGRVRWGGQDWDMRQTNYAGETWDALWRPGKIGEPVYLVTDDRQRKPALCRCRTVQRGRLRLVADND